jgi:hypothetical protein
MTGATGQKVEVSGICKCARCEIISDGRTM